METFKWDFEKHGTLTIYWEFTNDLDFFATDDIDNKIVLSQDEYSEVFSYIWSELF